MQTVCEATEALEIGQKVVHVFRITADDMDVFAELSGDWNPMHVDPAFAEAKGYRDRIVYGGLLLAKISALLGMNLPGRDGVWCSVRLSFNGPLYVGEYARMSGELVEFSPATGLATVKIEISAGERTVARGKAEVRVVSA